MHDDTHDGVGAIPLPVLVTGYLVLAMHRWRMHATTFTVSKRRRVANKQLSDTKLVRSPKD